AVQAVLETLVADGRETGIQVAAYLGDNLVVDAWAGIADPATGRMVDENTLFNVFSVSKAVTATAVHLQAERGLIDYDEPLATYWPEFTGDGRERVTVRHVLTHRSGMYPMPAGVTPVQICDWDFMVNWLQNAAPATEPGIQSGYQSLTFGWLLGELVRRTDKQHRPFGQFIQQEIAAPLGIDDLWIGLPEALDPRVAIMDGDAVTIVPEGTLYRVANPIAVDLMPNPFGDPKLRHACIPAVGGIFTARAQARFFAMLANGGMIGGVRLLSPERVASFSQPRGHFDEPEPVFFGMQIPLGTSGFWLGGGTTPPTCAPRNIRALCHPGMGGSIGWADPDTKLAVAFCHNRLFDALTADADSRTLIGDTIRQALGL
ncbi:MAG: serine hydrolase, partial [Acidocella sp.]|nr:serine hydrolase [Acidocella sp.]